MTEVMERQVDRLASRLSNEMDGDKTAESLLSLLGLLKNGKSKLNNWKPAGIEHSYCSKHQLEHQLHRAVGEEEYSTNGS